MRIAYPDEKQNKLLAQWASTRMDDVPKDGYQCIGILDEHDIRGVVMFQNFRWPNIEMGLICEDIRWIMNRALILEVMAYPFENLKCSRVTALIRRDNKRSRKLAKGMGFVEEGRLRKASKDGVDVFLYGLLADEFRLKR